MASRAARLRLEVLGGYRRLMKLRKEVFAGDQFAMGASAAKLREEFRRNKDVQDLSQIEGLVQGIADVEEMLSSNIVQGKKNQSGNYEVSIDSKKHFKESPDQEKFEPTQITHVDDRLTGDTVKDLRQTIAKLSRVVEKRQRARPAERHVG